VPAEPSVEVDYDPSASPDDIEAAAVARRQAAALALTGRLRIQPNPDGTAQRVVGYGELVAAAGAGIRDSGYGGLASAVHRAAAASAPQAAPVPAQGAVSGVAPAAPAAPPPPRFQVRFDLGPGGVQTAWYDHAALDGSLLVLAFRDDVPGRHGFVPPVRQANDPNGPLVLTLTGLDAPVRAYQPGIVFRFQGHTVVVLAVDRTPVRAAAQREPAW
jgi:hypothetical protein